MIKTDELRRMVFGCGNFGGLGSAPTLRDKGDDQERALAVLDHARDLGFTRLDTANTYGGGVSEMVLGTWLKRQDNACRASLQIATKVGNPHGCPPGDRPLSRTQVAEHLDCSLDRLGLEQISLYYIHEFDPVTPLEETLEAFDRALSAGKIAAFGVSNATLKDLKAVLALTSGRLRAAFTHVQNQFNLLEQGDLGDVIPLAQAENLDYVAFSPLAGGLLSGKYRHDQKAHTGRMADAPDIYESLLTASSFDAIETLRQHAASRRWTVPGAALRFILDAPGALSLIIAPRSIAQFDDYGIGAPKGADLKSDRYPLGRSILANNLEDWLSSVASGEAAMSQRGVRWVAAQGGLDVVVEAAKARGVHLVELTDDKGKTLIAASRRPFKALC